MSLAGMIDLLKKYWEPKRKELNAKVSKEGFGWTPCEHFQNCIGWCPRCLEWKHLAERMNRAYGEP